MIHGNNKDAAFLAQAAPAWERTIVLDAPDEAELAAAVGVTKALVRVTLGVDADTHEAIRTRHHGSKSDPPTTRARCPSPTTRSTAAWTSWACTCTSARSSRTSTPRRRRSCGLRRSSQVAVTRSAGWRRWPISAADSDPPSPGGRGPRRARARRERGDDGPARLRRGGVAAAGGLARAGPLPRGPAGVTLYRVGSVKRLPEWTWVAIDGGMSDNPRPQLDRARYTALSATRADEPLDEVVSVAGTHRESGYVLDRRRPAASPTPGDLLAVPATGAYTLAMASHYNGATVPRPCSSGTAKRASSAPARRPTTCSTSRHDPSRLGARRRASDRDQRLGEGPAARAPSWWAG